MARAIGIGNQDFEVIRKRGYFYVDKTKFIQDWWETGDCVTLITRPNGMIRGWSDSALPDYNEFVRALLLDDIKAMNIYMNRVTSEMFSSFDAGKKLSEKERQYE